VDPTVFVGDDLPAIEEFLSHAYARVRIGSSTERPSARVTRQRIGSVSLDRLQIGFEMSFAADPVGRVCVRHLRSGSVREQFGHGDEHRFGPGELTLLVDSDLPAAGHLRHVDSDVIMFDPRLLDRVSETAPRANTEPVRLLDHRPRSAAAARRLQQTIVHLRHLAADSAGVTPLVAAAAERLLAAVTLLTFPNTALLSPTPEDHHDAHPDTLRRAVAFIEAHPDTDISVTDVAAAACVSVRAVQLAFRRHLDTTPMTYLRRVRLECAHRELLAGDPARNSVGATAARWGFANPGRFAAAYRAIYTRPPSETLRA